MSYKAKARIEFEAKDKAQAEKVAGAVQNLLKKLTPANIIVLSRLADQVGDINAGVAMLEAHMNG